MLCIHMENKPEVLGVVGETLKKIKVNRKKKGWKELMRNKGGDREALKIRYLGRGVGEKT